MIAATFKRQPKWRKWGTLVVLFLSVVFIRASFLASTGVLFDARTKLSPFLSLMVLMLIFGSLLGSKLGAWGVLIGLAYSFFADVVLSLTDYHTYGVSRLQWLFPPFETLWVIIPSLFFALLGLMIDRWLLSSRNNESS